MFNWLFGKKKVIEVNDEFTPKTAGEKEFLSTYPDAFLVDFEDYDLFSDFLTDLNTTKGKISEGLSVSKVAMIRTHQIDSYLFGINFIEG